MGFRSKKTKNVNIKKKNNFFFKNFNFFNCFRKLRKHVFPNILETDVSEFSLILGWKYGWGSWKRMFVTNDFGNVCFRKIQKRLFLETPEACVFAISFLHRVYLWTFMGFMQGEDQVKCTVQPEIQPKFPLGYVMKKHGPYVFMISIQDFFFQLIQNLIVIGPDSTLGGEIVPTWNLKTGTSSILR